MEGNIVFLIASIKSRKSVRISHYFNNRLEMIRAVERYLDEMDVKYDTYADDNMTIVEKRRA